MHFREWYDWLELLPYLLDVALNEASIPQEYIDNVIGSSKFQQWLQSLGVTEPMEQPIEGGVGLAYPAGAFIIKFTPDSKEADAATVLKGYDSPNTAKVFDVKTVAMMPDKWDNSKRKPLFVIVQEKLNTGVSKRHRMAGQAIYDFMDRNAGFLRSSIDRLMPGVVSFLPHKWRSDEPTIRLVRQMLTSIKKIQDDRGFLTQDTHGANIALKGREPAFFDFGRSSLDFDNPATAGARVGRL